jgi:hypothetical protein
MANDDAVCASIVRMTTSKSMRWNKETEAAQLSAAQMLILSYQENRRACDKIL